MAAQPIRSTFRLITVGDAKHRSRNCGSDVHQAVFDERLGKFVRECA